MIDRGRVEGEEEYSKKKRGNGRFLSFFLCFCLCLWTERKGGIEEDRENEKIIV